MKSMLIKFSELSDGYQVGFVLLGVGGGLLVLFGSFHLPDGLTMLMSGLFMWLAVFMAWRVAKKRKTPPDA